MHHTTYSVDIKTQYQQQDTKPVNPNALYSKTRILFITRQTQFILTFNIYNNLNYTSNELHDWLYSLISRPEPIRLWPLHKMHISPNKSIKILNINLYPSFMTYDNMYSFRTIGSCPIHMKLNLSQSYYKPSAQLNMYTIPLTPFRLE